MLKILAIDPAVGKDIATAFYNGKWSFRSLPLHITKLKSYIEEKKPDCLIVEGQYYAKNIKTYGQLLEVRVLISTIAAISNIPVYVIPPQTWQKTIKTKRYQKSKELKILSQSIAIKELPDFANLFIRPDGDDLADAYNMGKFFINLKPEERLKYQWLI